MKKKMCTINIAEMSNVEYLVCEYQILLDTARFLLALSFLPCGV